MPDRDTVIAMAAKAGVKAAATYTYRGSFEAMTKPEQEEWLQLEAFAALVVAQEREECALVIEQTGPSEGPLKLVTDGFALAIRARKEET
jgi:hypothetical protein